MHTSTKVRRLYIVLVAFFSSSCSKNRLEVYKDFDIGTEITLKATVEVASNMGEIYLAVLVKSTMESVKTRIYQRLKILGSDFPLSGDFNLILIINY